MVLRRGPLQSVLPEEALAEASSGQERTATSPVLTAAFRTASQYQNLGRRRRRPKIRVLEEIEASRVLGLNDGQWGDFTVSSPLSRSLLSGHWTPQWGQRLGENTVPQSVQQWRRLQWEKRTAAPRSNAAACPGQRWKLQ